MAIIYRGGVTCQTLTEKVLLIERISGFLTLIRDTAKISKIKLMVMDWLLWKKSVTINRLLIDLTIIYAILKSLLCFPLLYPIIDHLIIR